MTRRSTRDKRARKRPSEPDVRPYMREGIETEATDERREATAKHRQYHAELLPMCRAYAMALAVNKRRIH